MLRFLIHRPVAVLLTTTGLMVLGFIVLKSLPVSLLPEVDVPRITVQASATGMTARELESSVTQPLRNTLMQVDGLQDIRSITRDGIATVELFFEHGTNTSLALLGVNEKTDLAMAYLPREVERPRVLKTSATDIPVFSLIILPKNNSGPTIGKLELAGLVNNVIKKRIEQLEEVAFVDVSGFANAEIYIAPHTQRFQRLGLTEDDLRAILQANEAELGNMLIQDGHYQYNVRLRTRLATIEDLRRISFRHGNSVVHLTDVADIGLRIAEPRGLFLHDDREGIVLTIRKKSGARLFSLRDAFRDLLGKLEGEYTQLDFDVTNDQTSLLDISIGNLSSSLQWGALFAFLVLFAFFREWRAPILMALVIPVSLVIALFGFYMLGISVNVISLSGLLLGVGLMIDNSIIVIENIRQYRSMGYSVAEACVRGPEEVIRPLLSSALTTCSVFVPLIFLSGLAGALFYDQAMSVTLALGASLAVAYILLPTLIFLRKIPPREATSSQLSYPFYDRMVDALLDRPWLSMSAIVAILAIMFSFINDLKKESFPAITKAGVMLRVDWNEPLDLGENRRRIRELTQVLSPALKSADASIGEQQFLLEKRNQAINEATVWLYGEAEHLLVATRKWFAEKFPTATAEVEPLKTLFDEIFSSDSPPLVAHLQHLGSGDAPDYDDVKPVEEWLRGQRIVYTMPATVQEYSIQILEEKALQYGVPLERIIHRLQVVFGKYPIGILRSSGEQLPIVVESRQVGLDEAMVFSSDGTPMPLKAFVRMEGRQAPRGITASKSGQSLDIAFATWPGEAFMRDFRRVVAKTGNLSVHFSGSHFDDRRRLRELVVILAVSLMLLYFILAAQFESLLLPVIVVLTVPIGAGAALLALYAGGQSLNLISLTGMVVMGGIVVNDAILKVDMMQRNAREMPLREAIHRAGARRLRPIVMTSATTILALLPVLFTEGLGAELQRPLAWAIIGGLTGGTLASLFVVPVLFQLVKREAK